MDTPLSGKVALVTGGSRGIGKAIALHLSRLGAKVAITARNPATLESLQGELEAAGSQFALYAAEVTDFARAQQVAADCTENLGPIDILVNNAGVSGEGGPILEQELEALWRTIEVNLRGPMTYAQAVLPGMTERGSGTIINMGSYAGIRPIPMNIPYATSKAALCRYTDSLAGLVAKSGVNVFTVSPGLVLTDMTRDEPVFKDVPPEVWSPIEAICSLVERLASKDCSSLTGRFIHVNDNLDQLLAEASKIESENLYTLRLNNLEGPVN